jgi:hypothetical protein
MPQFFRGLSATIKGFWKSKQSQQDPQFYRRKERELSEQEIVLRQKENQKQIKSAEKSRQRQYKLKQKAASKIQKAWKK